MDTHAPLVVAFDQILPPDVDRVQLLGGKGANLADMTQVLGLRVPPGFTITTNVCHRFFAEGWPTDLDGALAEQLERLGQRMGRRLGAPEAPLLVSVRSGAPVSMPGMLDTLLNVGMTPAVRNALAAACTPEFAADTWLRFCRMYAPAWPSLGIPSPVIPARMATT
jgi:pyruvate,orthophosphate dikinase